MGKTALVTGAAGFVGAAVVRELLSAGYSVRALCKASTNISPLAGLKIEVIRGDILDPSVCLSACQGVDTVFHIAALFRQAKFPDSEYFRVNRDGTEVVLNAAISAGVRKFVHCSTLGVHGDIPNPPADEDQPYAPCDVYQESKVEAEKVVLQAIAANKIDATIIRPAMIWGPGDRRLFKLFKGVFKRKMPLIGGGKQLCHWILVDDLARAFRLAAQTPAAKGRTYLIAGERPVTLKHTMQIIADTYNVKLLPFSIPALPLYAIGALCELICLPLKIEPPIFRRRVAFFMKSRAYKVERAKTELGFRASHSVQDEIRLIARWYREAGWL
jgi:dihydroflavonol-4-reductase